jgi:two-component system LytT family response regulator
MEVVGEYGDGREASQFIAKIRPDVVFLDIQMPDISGIQLLRDLPQEERPAVVFLTAHEEYALDAFEVEALDYLLKPIDDKRFEACLERIRRLLALKRQDSTLHPTQSAIEDEADRVDQRLIRHFIVRRGNTVAFVKTAQVDWIEGLGDYAGLHVGNKTHLIRESLTRLSARLDKTDFLRIHRSSIVRVERIAQVESLANRDLLVTLQDGTILRASRSYSANLQKQLQSGFGV